MTKIIFTCFLSVFCSVARKGMSYIDSMYYYIDSMCYYIDSVCYFPAIALGGLQHAFCTPENLLKQL